VPWVVCGRNVGRGGRRSLGQVMVMGRNAHEGDPRKGAAMGNHEKGLCFDARGVGGHPGRGWRSHVSRGCARS
jgi:hypothetical protein